MRIEGTDFDVMESDIEKMDSLIIEGMRLAVKRVIPQAGATLTAASEFSVSEDDVDAIKPFWRQYTEEVLHPFLIQIMVAQSVLQANRLFTALAFEVLPLDANMALEVYVENARNRLVGIGDELWFNARAAISEGVAEGESIQDIASRIEESVGVTSPRAERIARTEVIGARNAASYSTALRAGVGMDKEWLSTPDERTRVTHQLAGGQVAPMEAKFTVGNAQLKFPGDPDGPPEEIINCRCAIAYVVSDSETANNGNLVASDYQEGDTMPYEVVENHADCETDSPWGVVKDDGELMGCHDSEESAQAQVSALYAAEEEASSLSAAIEPSGNFAYWEGALVVEGVATGDGREFAPNSLSWPDTSSTVVALQWQKESTHGGMHDVTVNVGRVTEIYRQGNQVLGSGYIDLGHEDGAEVYRRMSAGTLAGVSIVADDPDDPMGFDVEYVMDDSCSLEDDEGDDGEISADEEDMRCFMPSKVIFHSGRIRALTLVDVPAFVEGSIALRDEVEEPHEEEALTAAAATITIPDIPPVEWFSEPMEKPEIGGITITDEGRIFGYLAPKNVAHRGIPDRRQTVPMGNVDYSRYMNRERFVFTSEGTTKIATGPITMGCGHASTHPDVSAQQSQDHYDNSCSIVATVAIGENRHGVWVAGALLPDVTGEQIARMMACQLSGDWRPHREKPGKRDFTGALLVPVPGFSEGKKAYSSLSIKSGVLVSSAAPVHFAEVVNEGEQPKLKGTQHEAFSVAARILAKEVKRDKASRLAQLRKIRGK